ncbi:hypothetical protein C8F04DRAFT_1091893 [Mycena alexandri]|uniref:Uncharacterized protein n=1 Tax=Mycena alexandri TaxID=1745969 RepID=A0AAD6T2J3_9AGAR|nr:hypothetical protein C8F04DRAFT_1091893 [Mycena alexandri]
MFNSRALLASTLAAVLAFAAAAPAKPSPEVPATIEVCSGNCPTGGVTLTVVSDDCINLTGGLSFLDKEISQAIVPGGFVCTFFQDFGCIASGTGNAPTNSEVVLTGGTWSLSHAPGLSGTINFNDLTSSISCSPI